MQEVPVSKETRCFSWRKFQCASLPLGYATRKTQWLNAQGEFSKLLGNKALSREIGFIRHSYLKQTMNCTTAWGLFSSIPVVTCTPSLLLILWFINPSGCTLACAKPAAIRELQTQDRGREKTADHHYSNSTASYHRIMRTNFHVLARLLLVITNIDMNFLSITAGYSGWIHIAITLSLQPSSVWLLHTHVPRYVRGHIRRIPDFKPALHFTHNRKHCGVSAHIA